MIMTSLMTRSTLCALTLFFLGCGDAPVQQSVPKASPALPVETITLEKSPYPVWLQYTGKTRASNSQEVRARVEGRLEKVYFKDGDIVKAGEPLFLIEQEQYRSALDAAIATKARNEASLELARADVARYTPLVEEGLAPRATLEQYQAQANGLTAQIAADQASIDKAQLQLGYTEVKAPIAGRVSRRMVDTGNLVGHGEATLLTTIMQIDPLYAYFSPTLSDVELMQRYRSKEVLDAYIEVRSTNEAVIASKRLDGSVDFSDNTVDDMTSTLSMRATMNNPDYTVYPGTFVYVNVFVTDQMPIVLVPPRSIFEDQLGKYVYVNDAGKAKRVNIKTGYASRYYTMVEEGLEGGEALIISGLMKLRPNLAISTSDATAEKGIDAILKANHLIPEKE